VPSRTASKVCFAGVLLIALIGGAPATAQTPTITMSVSPAAGFLGQDITFTITVESPQKVTAGVIDPVPYRTKFVSVQHSGPNVPTEKCTEVGGYNPLANLTPGSPSFGKRVQCPIVFPGRVSITLVVSALSPGVVTNSAVLLYESQAHPVKIKYVSASASVNVNPGMPLFSNFGPASGCPVGRADDCISPNSFSVNGANSAGLIPPFTLAASFTPVASLKLSAIELPFSVIGSADTFNVWITADNNGTPGTVLELIKVTNFPTATPPPFTEVTIIASSARPALASGTQFWLVIGPGDNAGFGQWFASSSDTATSTNFLNSTATTLNVMPLAASDWSAIANSTQQITRVAFQIDGLP